MWYINKQIIIYEYLSDRLTLLVIIDCILTISVHCYNFNYRLTYVRCVMSPKTRRFTVYSKIISGYSITTNTWNSVYPRQWKLDIMSCSTQTMFDLRLRLRYVCTLYCLVANTCHNDRNVYIYYILWNIKNDYCFFAVSRIPFVSSVL